MDTQGFGPKFEIDPGAQALLEALSSAVVVCGPNSEVLAANSYGHQVFARCISDSDLAAEFARPIRGIRLNAVLPEVASWFSEVLNGAVRTAPQSVKFGKRHIVMKAGHSRGVIPGVEAVIVELRDETDERLEWEAQKKQLEDAIRIRTAVDNASTNIMIADRDLRIVYMNRSVERLLRNATNDLQKDLPGFDVDKLMGANIDRFHKNPAHQRSLIQATRASHEANISVGGRSFRLLLNPARADDGTVYGYALEWADRTDQLRAESEVKQTLEAAAQGRLSERLRVDSLQGFMRTLGENINALLDTVVNPIRETIRVAESLSQGDLTVRLTGNARGELGQLRNSVNKFIDKQNEILLSVKSAANQVASAADQLRGTSHRLADGAQTQGAALQESSSGLEETSSMVRANAESARVANGLTVSTVDTVDLGRQKMSDMVNAMERITQSSEHIARIIKVIDEIAFQTNLLALNAAVEAARAGRHGRGFAVVAQEVRSLAERSAKAAKETSELIQGALDSVRKGSIATTETSSVLAGIASNITKVRDIVAEISAASDEQARGVSEISASMSQINGAAQIVREQSTEVASASEELKQQVTGLAESLGGFQLTAPKVAAGEVDLSRVPPELMMQLLAALQSVGAVTGGSAQHAPGAAAAVRQSARAGKAEYAQKAPSSQNTQAAFDPRSVLPLDEDERGYGDF
jgi:methyl-accepting chemotaxis protein